MFGPSPVLRNALLATLITVAVIGVYSGGLSGPFLFDDHVHITHNRWVHIDSVSWPNLAQAWHSSFSPFPTNRPLAQVSFGINHAFAGLSPWAFKATNLAIHLACGLLVFALTRMVYRLVAGDAGNTDRELMFAAMTTALWLLHPMHVSTVMYVVQRMAQISALGLLAAMCCYVWGRIRLSQQRSGLPLILLAPLLAAVGFLGKENAALLPLLLLVTELTLLRNLSSSNHPWLLRSIWLFFIAIPILAAGYYFLLNPGYFDFSGRPFSLEERALTQARVLWLYLRWLFVPDLGMLGLYHDDIQLSQGLLQPPQTLVAVASLFALVAAALLLRRRWPVFAFAVLFFLSAHALESSVFPLEPVFEHRNYLASIGPLMLLAWLVVEGSRQLSRRGLALTLGGLLLFAYSTVTYLRVDNWSSYERFVFATAANHPESPRANFSAAKLLIASLGQGDPALDVDRAEAAEVFLRRGLEADQDCINCLFGQVVLALHLDRYPEPELLNALRRQLLSGPVGATKVAISQFSYLVRWQRSNGLKLHPSDLESLFDTALQNPVWSPTGRGGIEAAYREYHEFVSGDLERALRHATQAIAAWPQQWSYHLQRVDVLIKMARYDDALDGLDAAAPLAVNEKQHERMMQTRARIGTLLQR